MTNQMAETYVALEQKFDQIAVKTEAKVDQIEASFHKNLTTVGAVLEVAGETIKSMAVNAGEAI